MNRCPTCGEDGRGLVCDACGDDICEDCVYIEDGGEYCRECWKQITEEGEFE